MTEAGGHRVGKPDPSVLFRALFMHMAEGVALHEIVLDRGDRPIGYRIVEVNPQYERFMGMPRGRLVGKLATEVFGPGDPRSLDVYSQAVREDRPARLETRCPVTDREYDVSVAPMGSGFFATIMVDVTERKLQEKALRESEQALRSKSDELDRIFSLTLDMLCIVRPDGHLLRVNAAWERVLGWPIGELEGSPLLDFVHAEDVPATREAMHELASGRDLIDFTNRCRCRDGTYRFIEWRSVPAGGVIYAAARDVSERKKSQAERQRLEQQLLQSQKMESVGLLAGGVAHDFNNLLTVILGCTDEVAQRMGSDGEPHGPLSEVTHAAQRAAELTHQLLAFSRRQVLQPRVLDLNHVVADVSRMLGRMLGENVRLELLLGGEVGAVFADPGQLQQIIVNLAVNARDAMPQGGTLTFQTTNVPPAEVTEMDLGDLSPGSYVALVVRDTGLGMDEVTRRRIFEPFFTTKGEMGTGLGLATVYGIVKQSGGQILVSSRPGAGTTFNVLLPRAEPGLSTFAPASHPPRLLEGRETVLLVEDEAQVRAVLKKVLVGAGYVVLEASNAEEASLVNDQFGGTIHALVTDVVMPGKTGMELVRYLTSIRPHMRVLYMSGYAPDPPQLTSGFDDGFAFLQKPITPPQLLATLRDVLDAP